MTLATYPRPATLKDVVSGEDVGCAKKCAENRPGTICGEWKQISRSLLTSCRIKRGIKFVERPSMLGVQEVPGSNPGVPTIFLNDFRPTTNFRASLWSPTGVQDSWVPVRFGWFLRYYFAPFIVNYYHDRSLPLRPRVLKVGMEIIPTA